MLCDFSCDVIGFDGKAAEDDGKKLPLMHWVKMVVNARLKDDAETRDFSRKLMRIAAKLDRAEDNKVELNQETLTFLRDRLLKAQFIPAVYFAFERITDPLTDEEISTL